MDKQDVVKLRKNYSFLVKNLAVDSVMDYLHQEGVLSEDDLERVGAEVTSQDQARKLLAMLPKRTKDAYPKLLQALNMADVTFIAEQLEQTVISQEDLDDSPNSLDLNYPSAVANEEVLYAIQVELRQRYTEQFHKVNPLPWLGEMVISLPDVYTDLLLKERDTYNRARDSHPISVDDIFACCPAKKDSQMPKRVYIQGIAGMGKTVLCNKLAYDWAQKRPYLTDKFAAVFFLEMKEGIVESNVRDTIIEQLFPIDFKYSRQSVLSCLNEYQSEVLLIIDGYDELSPLDKQSVESFLEGKYLHQVSCVVTSRPTNLAAKHFDRRLKCSGFSAENARRFVDKYFNSKPKEYSKSLMDRVENSCYLRQLVENPLDCLLLCVHWEDNEGKLPRSLSQLFFSIVEIINLRYVARHNKKRDVLECDAMESVSLLDGLKELAFKSIVDGRREFSVKEVRSVLNHEEVLKMGILSRAQPKSLLSREVRYCFTQRNIQEVLAAMYFPLLANEDRQKYFRQFLAERKTALLVIFVMGVFKTNDTVLEELFEILAENNRSNCEMITFEWYDSCDGKTVVSFNKITRPFTVSFHALNEAESKQNQKFVSLIASSMPKNLFLDLKSLRNHFLCHDISHSCFMILESMPCPERVMVMEFSYFLENRSVEAVEGMLTVLHHVSVHDPKQFDLFIYCDGLNFAGYSSIPWFLHCLMNCMAMKDKKKFFEKRVRSVNFLLPDCYRLREMNSTELEQEMKLNQCPSTVKLPPLVVYTDKKCDHLDDDLKQNCEQMCPAKKAAFVFQKINTDFDITWKKASLPIDFIQELY